MTELRYLLDEKASPGDAHGFKETVYALARKVGESSGFLGDASLQAKERAALRTVCALLGYARPLQGWTLEQLEARFRELGAKGERYAEAILSEGDPVAGRYYARGDGPNEYEILVYPSEAEARATQPALEDLAGKRDAVFQASNALVFVHGRRRAPGSESPIARAVAALGTPRSD